MLNLIKFVVGLVGVFWLAIAGAWLEYRFEHRPHGWPSYTLSVPLGPWTIRHTFTVPGLGDGPYARLAALEAAERQAGRRAVQVETRQAQIAASGQALEVKAQTRIHAAKAALDQDIRDAITPHIDVDFPLSVGFVRAHDAAALGVGLSLIPQPLAGADDARAVVAPSDALAVINANYADCRADAEQLTRLQAEWAADLVAQHDPAGEDAGGQSNNPKR